MAQDFGTQAAAVHAATKGAKVPVNVSLFVGCLGDIGENGVDPNRSRLSRDLSNRGSAWPILDMKVDPDA
jgi:hypothetical protein